MASVDEYLQHAFKHRRSVFLCSKSFKTHDFLAKVQALAGESKLAWLDCSLVEPNPEIVESIFKQGLMNEGLLYISLKETLPKPLSRLIPEFFQSYDPRDVPSFVGGMLVMTAEVSSLQLPYHVSFKGKVSKMDLREYFMLCSIV